MTTISQYEEAMQVIYKEKEIYSMAAGILRYMKKGGHAPNHFTNPAELISRANIGMLYLVDRKNDFLKIVNRLIKKFGAKAERASILVLLNEVKETLKDIRIACAPEKEERLNAILLILFGEVERMIEEIDTLQHTFHCGVIRRCSEKLLAETVSFLPEQRKVWLVKYCDNNFESTSWNTMGEWEVLKDRGAKLSRAVQVIGEFIGDVTGALDAIYDELKLIKSSDPAKHPEEMLLRVEKVNVRWEQLMDVLLSKTF